MSGTRIYAYVGGNPVSYSDPSGLAAQGVAVGGAIGLAICMRSPACVNALVRGCAKLISLGAGAVGVQVIYNETAENDACEGSSCGSGSDSATPAPAIPGDPYSPGEVDKRRSEWRRELGAPSQDPNSPIPDQSPGRDMGGHGARGATPHVTGERNVNPNQEHLRRTKGNPTGLPRR